MEVIGLIEICNLRKEKPTSPCDVKVDRSSVLGNPFPMFNESKRDLVCEKYKDYFYNSLIYKPEASKELQRLIAIHNEYGTLRLFCWCFPKRCHGETIKEYLEK